MRNPDASIVIPCFNETRFLLQAVDSALGQQGVCVEVLVVDDGSTEREALELLDHVASRGVHNLRKPHSGLASTRNVGVAASKAPYVVCLDADDALAPSYCAHALDVIRSSPDVGFVYPSTQVVGDESRLWSNREFSLLALLINNPVPYVAMFRKEAWQQVGGYPLDFPEGYEDWAFWLSLVAAGWRGKWTGEVGFYYRRHGESMLTRANMQRSMLKRRLRRKFPDLYNPGYILRRVLQHPEEIPGAVVELLKEQFRPVIR